MMIGNRLIEIARLMIMVMDVACFYIGLSLFTQSSRNGYLALVIMMAVYPVCIILNYVVLRGSAALSKNILTVNIICGTAVVLFIIAIQVWRILSGYGIFQAATVTAIGFQVVFGAIAWWLGYRLASVEISHREVLNHLQVGILAVLILTAFGARAFLPVVIFFAAALVALAVARWQSSVANSYAVLKSFRAMLVIFTITIISLLGIFVTLLLSPDLSRQIWGWLAMAASFVNEILRLDKIQPSPGKPLDINFSCSFKPSGEGGEISPSLPTHGGETGTAEIIILWLFFVAFILIILFVVFLLIKKVRMQKHVKAGINLDVESTTIRLNIYSQLMFVLKTLTRWFRSVFLSVAGIGRTASRWWRVAGDEPILSVRTLYKHLLKWALKRGVPRISSQTPLEYLDILSGKLPQKKGELAALTEIYIEARYSGQPQDEAKLEIGKQVWLKIKKIKRL